MNTQTIERQDVAQYLFNNLSDNSMSKLIEYADFLRYQEQIEEQEDAEDIADAEARKDESTVPMSKVIKNYEAKYGPLD